MGSRMTAFWYNNRHALAAAIACIMIFSSTQSANAAVSTRERLAEALATTRLCKNVSLNQKTFNKAARKAGLDIQQGSSDMKMLEQGAEYKVQRLRKFDRRIICLLGETDFGPQGIAIRNLLRVHKRTPPITRF